MNQKWWHDQIFYQIYPKSFADANGDGIGDLQGIIHNLPELKELGIDVIWLSPVYASPMIDQGYDISDYYNINPIYGTMQDMDELLRRAKDLDIRILMDLVINHCSDQHEWFQEACKNPDGKYGSYFYIRDWHEGEPLPCNWRSYFGGPVWDLLPGHTDKIYYHSFHRSQPDLNWSNPALFQDLCDMINWWLDKGLSGFRIDAIINIEKNLSFPSYAPDREDGLSSLMNMVHGTEEIHEKLNRTLNRLADQTFRKHDAFTVAEMCDDDISILPLYIGEKGCFSSIFDFQGIAIGYNPVGWYASEKPTAEQYKQAMFVSQTNAQPLGFFSNVIENHDEPRGVNRFLHTALPTDSIPDSAKKMLGGLNFFLKGVPFIYQGQEIGMENLVFHSIDEVNDISTLAEYQTALDAGLPAEEALRRVGFYSRDNARTPYQWNDQPNAGFTTGNPWLAVNPNYCRINLSQQKENPDSVWSFYRQMIALRKSQPWKDTFVYGETIPYLRETKNLIAYYREYEHKILVLGNFQAEPQQIPLPEGNWKLLLSNEPIQTCDSTLLMQGFQFAVYGLE